MGAPLGTRRDSVLHRWQRNPQCSHGRGNSEQRVGDSIFPIIALYVLEEQLPVALAEPPGPPAVPDVALVWGRADGAVLGMVRGETTTYQEPTAGTTVSSVYSTGGRILWIEQVSSGKKSSRVLMSFQGVTTTLSSDVGDWDLMADEVAAYWASYSGVEKYTF